ncbi:hypothetical protein ALO45_101217 [Pseudomonas syringae pv. syringae]|mgnify:FL=1|nr:hypothetical protein ALO45_101217 [Pseudomonas syringae pv. syringae]
MGHPTPMSLDIVKRVLMAQSNSMAQAFFNTRLPQPGPYEQTLMSIPEIRYL